MQREKNAGFCVLKPPAFIVPTKKVEHLYSSTQCFNCIHISLWHWGVKSVPKHVSFNSCQVEWQSAEAVSIFSIYICHGENGENQILDMINYQLEHEVCEWQPSTVTCLTHLFFTFFNLMEKLQVICPAITQAKTCQFYLRTCGHGVLKTLASICHSYEGISSWCVSAVLSYNGGSAVLSYNGGSAFRIM